MAQQQQLRGTILVDGQLYHLEPAASTHKLYHNSLVRRSLDARKVSVTAPTFVWLLVQSGQFIRSAFSYMHAH
jgi:hypothetical protein